MYLGIRVDGTVNNRFVISIYVFLWLMGTARYLRLLNISIICSTHVRAETNQETYVAVSTVLCLLEYQYTEVLLTKQSMHVTE